MNKQRGLSLISVLIVGSFVMAVLVLGMKMIPVFNEYFEVKKGFKNVVAATDPGAPATAFRSAFGKHRDVNDITSVDPQMIVISKEDGRVTLSVSYRREVPLFSIVGLYFDFDVTSN